MRRNRPRPQPPRSPMHRNRRRPQPPRSPMDRRLSRSLRAERPKILNDGELDGKRPRLISGPGQTGFEPAPADVRPRHRRLPRPIRSERRRGLRSTRSSHRLPERPRRGSSRAGTIASASRRRACHGSSRSGGPGISLPWPSAVADLSSLDRRRRPIAGHASGRSLRALVLRSSMRTRANQSRPWSSTTPGRGSTPH